MNNSHTDFDENEGAASIDPGFSASFRESFKMDYFATADQGTIIFLSSVNIKLRSSKSKFFFSKRDRFFYKKSILRRGNILNNLAWWNSSRQRSDICFTKGWSKDMYKNNLENPL